MIFFHSGVMPAFDWLKKKVLKKGQLSVFQRAVIMSGSRRLGGSA